MEMHQSFTSGADVGMIEYAQALPIHQSRCQRLLTDIHMSRPHHVVASTE